MSASQGPYSDDRGTWFLALGWTLTSLAVTTIVLRLYTRLVLTRSAGSDDLAIAFCLGLTIAGEIGDSIAVAHGLGRHQQYLNDSDVASIVKWEFIDLINVFISLFFLRTSIMLFTLRLLPATKIWPQRIIVLAFFLNFAITMIIIVTYGVKCVPFTAIYKSDPTAKCAPQSTVVITQQLNGIIACIIDIVTALIPAFLLWKIRIKRSTKIMLDIIFLCGLITAGLSIGRAATTNTSIWQEDTSWRIQPPNTFSMVEEKAGLIFACCPSLRQLVVHILRTHTILPRKRKQGPGEDFVKMRTKVKLRDIFWYRRPSQLATFSGSPTYPPESVVSKKTKEKAEAEAKKSPLSLWKTSLGAVFGKRKAMRKLSSDQRAAPPIEREEEKVEEVTEPGHREDDNGIGSWPGSRNELEQKRIAGRYREWDLSPFPANMRKAQLGTGESSPFSFLRENSDEKVPQVGGSSVISSSEPSKSAMDSTPESSESSTRRVPRRNRAVNLSTVLSDRIASTNFSRPRQGTPPNSQVSRQETLSMDQTKGSD